MGTILLDDGRKVVFDDANKLYAKATIYQPVPFLLFTRYVRVCSVFLIDENYRIKTKKEIVKELVDMADYKIEWDKKADEFNRSEYEC